MEHKSRRLHTVSISFVKSSPEREGGVFSCAYSLPLYISLSLSCAHFILSFLRVERCPFSPDHQAAWEVKSVELSTDEGFVFELKHLDGEIV